MTPEIDKRKIVLDKAIINLEKALVEMKTAIHLLGQEMDIPYFVDLSRLNTRHAIKQLKVRRANL